MSDNKIKAILDLASKHAQRAVDNEELAAARAQDTRAKHLEAVRHNARLDGLALAITEIRKIADEWSASAEEASKYGRKNDGDVVQRREHAARLNDLAFQLLSEVDES